MKNKLCSVVFICATLVVFLPSLCPATETTESADSTVTEPGTIKNVRLVQYCLTEETKLPVEGSVAEPLQSPDAFPRYGSREERLYRQSATLFSYNGSFDNKVKRAFRLPTKEQATSNCVYVQESVSQ